MIIKISRDLREEQMNAMRSLTRIRRHKEELNRADENKIEVKKKYTRKNQHILEDTEG